MFRVLKHIFKAHILTLKSNANNLKMYKQHYEHKNINKAKATKILSSRNTQSVAI